MDARWTARTVIRFFLGQRPADAPSEDVLLVAVAVALSIAVVAAVVGE